MTTAEKQRIREMRKDEGVEKGRERLEKLRQTRKGKSRRKRGRWKRCRGKV